MVVSFAFAPLSMVRNAEGDSRYRRQRALVAGLDADAR
jgi:hypothetical protein